VVDWEARTEEDRLCWLLSSKRCFKVRTNARLHFYPLPNRSGRKILFFRRRGLARYIFPFVLWSWSIQRLFIFYCVKCEFSSLSNSTNPSFNTRWQIGPSLSCPSVVVCGTVRSILQQSLDSPTQAVALTRRTLIQTHKTRLDKCNTACSPSSIRMFVWFGDLFLHPCIRLVTNPRQYSSYI